MNYLKIYFKIIRKAKTQKRIKTNEVYFENHHIRPKSLGGSNKSKNKILLTSREHFICHALLAKYFKKNVKYMYKMIKAFHKMGYSNKYHVRYMNSRLYEANKSKLYGINAIVPPPMKGKKHSEETKQKMSLIRMGIEFSEDHKNNLSKNSAWKGKKPWNYGKTATDEAKKNQSIAQLNSEKVKCPFCEKITTKSALSRHVKSKHREGVSNAYPT